MKNGFILLMATICAALTAVGAYSQSGGAFSPKAAFQKASQYYESGDYGKAISAHEDILKKGVKSGNVFYNLGNCYFKKGELGRAILNYERARYFIPRDGALLSNYRYAKSKMKQRDALGKASVAIRKLNNMFEYLTLGEAAVVFNMAYYLCAFFIVFSLFFKKFRIPFRILSFLLLCTLIVLIAPLASKIGDLRTGAIVIGKIADAKLEPVGEDAMSGFPVYEGMKVYIIREQRGWNKIKRPDGKIGWVEQENVERIF